MKKMSTGISVVAGGAGFVGSNLTSRLLAEGRDVVVMDNFCRGNEKYIPRISLGGRLEVIRADLSRRDECSKAFERASELGVIDEVWHLAANSDIPAGIIDSDIDLKDTFLTTSELLRCIKSHGIPKLFFASSSAIYGDLGSMQLREDIGPLLPISNYGAMKLASEALISAASESFISLACLFRFPNVVGVPATHGVILDFIRRLKLNGEELSVLGDGTQCKAYLHISDLVDAMLFIRRADSNHKVLPINIGPIDAGVLVSWIAQQVVARVAPNAIIRYGVGNKGWVGDVPRFHYSVEKLMQLGWRPTLNSEQAVIRAIDEIASQEGL